MGLQLVRLFFNEINDYTVCIYEQSEMQRTYLKIMFSVLYYVSSISENVPVTCPLYRLYRSEKDMLSLLFRTLYLAYMQITTQNRLQKELTIPSLRI
jgi:hypothetical protein